MKKLFHLFTFMALLFVTSCSYDDTDIWDKLHEQEQTLIDHEKRIAALEELCKRMNTNIEALQTIVAALEQRDYITNVSEVRSNGEVIGYTISFGKNDTITIYHGQDGKDGTNGKDGYIPQIGVMKDTDGIYYWTLDCEWLLDANGNKIKAVGTDGTNGTDGKNGKDGVTPQLKIENDYWYVSYDEGATWDELGKATGKDGENGKDGNNGIDGDSLFTDVSVGEDSVCFTLADGTVIVVPLANSNNGGESTENNKIYYTTVDGKKLFPTTTEPALFGAILISNTYKDGQGVLTFDDSITYIGEEAFKNCSSLASVTIPNSVASIEQYAFYGCSSLASVSIGNSVNSIGYAAFFECSSLEEVHISDIAAWCKIKFVTWNDNPLCYARNLYLNNELVTDLVIPDSVTSIGEKAFCYCSSLTSVTIPDSVTEIGDYAFDTCSSLASVSIGNSVTEIGDYAFFFCSSLASVSIGNSVTKIGDDAFFNCLSLASVTIPDSVTEIGERAFYHCLNLKSVTIGANVTSIGAGAFCNCYYLESVYFKPNTPPGLGDAVFYYLANDNNVYWLPYCTFYVPRESIGLYESTSDRWSQLPFAIEGYDF